MKNEVAIGSGDLADPFYLRLLNFAKWFCSNLASIILKSAKMYVCCKREPVKRLRPSRPLTFCTLFYRMFPLLHFLSFWYPPSSKYWASTLAACKSISKFEQSNFWIKAQRHAILLRLAHSWSRTSSNHNEKVHAFSELVADHYVISS